jgi:hypothetical protein
MPDFEKDPNETVAFTWDWSDDCAVQSTTVSSVVFVVPTGITKASQSNTTTTASALFTGGTTGRGYPVTCRATFANGEVLDYTKTIRVREK